jgi:propanediol utilization protein
MKKNKISIKVSARHIHLSQTDLETLFGEEFQLTKRKDIDQPGQFVAQEKLTLQGPKGKIENVSVVGPPREKSQVEISKTDSITLGIDPPVEKSTIEPTKTPAEITIKGPKGNIKSNLAIIAHRHVHISPEEAVEVGLEDDQKIGVEIGGKRGLVFKNVLVRVDKKYSKSVHIDTDEANAAGIDRETEGKII